MNSTPSPLRTILAFGPAPWPRGWVSGSPRYHLFGLASAGHRVLYVEPAQGRWRQWLGRAARGLPGARMPGAFERWPDRALHIYTPRCAWFAHPRMPFTRGGLRRLNALALRALAREVLAAVASQPELRDFAQPDLLWLGGWNQAPLLDCVPHAHSAAFLYDDLPASPAWTPRQARWVRQAEEELVRRVELLIVTSLPLFETRKDAARSLLLLENAVDDRVIEAAQADSELARPATRSALPPPEWQRMLDSIPRPRLGYLGALNLRLDGALVEALARAAERHKWSLVFVGPVDRLYRGQIERWRHSPAVTLLGMVPPADVPAALGRFDALLLPHAVNTFTRAMFPEKLPEYLATGRPIVSTRLPEVERVAAQGPGGTVWLASNAEEFVAACERALREDSTALQGARRALARRHTRSLRLARLIEALDQLFRKP